MIVLVYIFDFEKLPDKLSAAALSRPEHPIDKVLIPALHPALQHMLFHISETEGGEINLFKRLWK